MDLCRTETLSVSRYLRQVCSQTGTVSRIGVCCWAELQPSRNPDEVLSHPDGGEAGAESLFVKIHREHASSLHCCRAHCKRCSVVMNFWPRQLETLQASGERGVHFTSAGMNRHECEETWPSSAAVIRAVAVTRRGLDRFK